MISFANTTRRRSTAGAWLGSLVLLSAAPAWAQDGGSVDPAAAPAAPPPSMPDASAPVPAPASESLPAGQVASAPVDPVAARLDRQQAELDSANKKIEELSRQLAAVPPPPEPDHRFQFYGYTDVGVDEVWGKSGQPLAAFLNSYNSTSFVVGNIDLYMDAQPVQGWRSLVEVRFTNAPNGNVTSLGGLAGTFSRQSTKQIDPGAATADGYMFGGFTVIERAQIDWTDWDFFKLRAGMFLTPFGIWNMDHGTPTLISLQLPQAMVYEMFPRQQVGLMAYGNHVFGAWDVGYMATISNGRLDEGPFQFDGNPPAVGGRIYANSEGDVTTKIGLSGYTGRPRNQEIDLTSVSPIVVTTKSTYAYREYTAGADFSLDVGATRLRAEALMHRVQYDPGQHQAANFFVAGGVGGTFVNRFEYTGYALVAHQLPILGLEPFAMLDSVYGPVMGLADLILIPSVGLNIHFNPYVQLKTQFARSMLFNARKQAGSFVGTDVGANDIDALYSRLVVAF